MSEQLNTLRNLKKKENNSYSFNKIGFLEALTLLFIGLKLTDVIAWSWWWVLSPLWIPVVVVFSLAILLFIIIAVLEAKK